MDNGRTNNEENCCIVLQTLTNVLNVTVGVLLTRNVRTRRVVTSVSAMMVTQPTDQDVLVSIYFI